MIVRTLAAARLSNRRVVAENWESVRLLLADERMGFSFHITTIYAGTETHIHYRNHLEAVFCMRGRGEVQTLAVGNIYPIEPGTVYILDRHDEFHEIEAAGAEVGDEQEDGEPAEGQAEQRAAAPRDSGPHLAGLFSGSSIHPLFGIDPDAGPTFEASMPPLPCTATTGMLEGR